MKVKRKFQYEDITLQIVEREEPYMNAKEPLLMTRVIAPNGGVIPVSINHRETLKSITEKTIDFIDGMKARGADVIDIMTKPLN